MNAFEKQLLDALRRANADTQAKRYGVYDNALDVAKNLAHAR